MILGCTHTPDIAVGKPRASGDDPAFPYRTVVLDT